MRKETIGKLGKTLDGDPFGIMRGTEESRSKKKKGDKLGIYDRQESIGSSISLMGRVRSRNDLENIKKKPREKCCRMRSDRKKQGKRTTHTHQKSLSWSP